MKFGARLQEQIDPEYADKYLNYDLLKSMILEMEANQCGSLPDDNLKIRSLTLGPPTNSAGQPLKQSNFNQERFFATLEDEMRKIDNFTSKKVIILIMIIRVFVISLNLGERN